jgi:translation initiation factor 6 (eIF-6)
MIQEYVADLALQMGIKKLKVSVVDGESVGCLDSYLLNISSNGFIVSALVYQSEMDDLEKGMQGERFEVKIRSALSRLSLMIES